MNVSVKKYLLLGSALIIVPLLITACDYNWGFGQGKKDSEIVSLHTDQFSKEESIAVTQTWLMGIGNPLGISDGCKKSLLSSQIDWNEESMEAGVWQVSAVSKPDDSEEVTTYLSVKVYEGTNSIKFSENNVSKLKACN